MATAAAAAGGGDSFSRPLLQVQASAGRRREPTNADGLYNGHGAPNSHSNLNGHCIGCGSGNGFSSGGGGYGGFGADDDDPWDTCGAPRPFAAGFTKESPARAARANEEVMPPLSLRRRELGATDGAEGADDSDGVDGFADVNKRDEDRADGGGAATIDNDDHDSSGGEKEGGGDDGVDLSAETIPAQAYKAAKRLMVRQGRRQAELQEYIDALQARHSAAALSPGVSASQADERPFDSSPPVMGRGYGSGGGGGHGDGSGRSGDGGGGGTGFGVEVSVGVGGGQLTAEAAMAVAASNPDAGPSLGASYSQRAAEAGVGWRPPAPPVDASHQAASPSIGARGGASTGGGGSSGGRGGAGGGVGGGGSSSSARFSAIFTEIPEGNNQRWLSASDQWEFGTLTGAGGDGPAVAALGKSGRSWNYDASVALDAALPPPLPPPATHRLWESVYASSAAALERPEQISVSTSRRRGDGGVSENESFLLRHLSAASSQPAKKCGLLRFATSSKARL
ncbi:unnamed protein product [Phaeothamnion confervicola]